MSIELKQAAQQALEALEFSETEPHRPQYEVEASAMRALRTAIQQAEAKTDEPVACMASYVDPIGNDHVYVTSHHDLAVENDMHGTPRPLYTHPAPGVPDGYVLVPVEPTDEMYEAGYDKLRDIHSGPFNGSPSLGHAGVVWRAMLTAAQAQKGQP